MSTFVISIMMQGDEGRMLPAIDGAEARNRSL